ncbi:MAG: PASTA domain-containing protein [bacterium]
MIPDVLALPLEEARRLLEGAGVTVRPSETRPPRGGEGRGALRVVRQRHEGEAVLLTVTAERYERPAVNTPPSSAGPPATA